MDAQQQQSSSTIENAVNRSKGFWQRTSMNQKVVLLVIAAIASALFALFIMWLNQPNYKTLYSNLTPEDANKVVTLLKENNVKYEITDGGKTINVPDNMVYDMRMKVAGEAGLAGSGIGFEIFNEVKMGQTEFVQKINYQRALQGEIARTLSELPNVESARVHLVLPEKSLFIEEQESPSASVVLKLETASAVISKSEVNSIVNLLAMAVQGLDKHHISITDSSGNPIYSPEEEGFGATNSQLEYRLRVEKSFERRINELLIPILGSGKSIAKVNAELDYSQRTYRKETFDPDSQVVRSEQKSEENQQGQANLEGGSPDANFNGDGLSNSISTQNGTREQSTVNYEINKVEENIIGQMGEIIRLTVAVAIDGTYIQEEDGTYTYVARTEEEIARIKELVSHAVGYSEQRGDTIEVSNLAFDDTGLPEEVNSTELMIDFATKMMKTLLIALLVFVFIMLIVRPIILGIIRPRVESGEVLEGLEGLPAAEEQYALFEAQDQQARQSDLLARQNMQALSDASIFNLEDGLSIEEIKAKTLQLSERSMEQTISIMREWINEPKSKAA